MDIHWEQLRPILENHTRFILSSHVRPDADAIGSELALAALLESMGKSVRIVNPSATPPNLGFLDPDCRVLKIGEDVNGESVSDCDVHIVVDTSAWVQLGEVGNVFKETPAVKVVIDHHSSSDDLGAVEFKDDTAEATGMLIVQMARALGYPITRQMAIPLFCAIATDTGWFRFPSTNSRTYRIAGELIDAGARPHIIYHQLYEQCSFARMKLAGRALNRISLEFEGRLGYTWVMREDFTETGARPVDTEDLVNECLRIAGTQCAFIATEQFNGRIKVSLRSRTDLNVAEIAEQFGGGGHKQAAGAILDGTMNEVKQRMIDAFGAAMSGLT